MVMVVVREGMIYIFCSQGTSGGEFGGEKKIVVKKI